MIDNNKNIITNDNGRLFENQLAYHINTLNDELTKNIVNQSEIIINFLKSFEYIDIDVLPYKEQKRVEALESWFRSILENIDKFYINRITNSAPKFIDEVYTTEELKKEFDELVDFMTKEIEIEEQILEKIEA